MILIFLYYSFCKMWFGTFHQRQTMYYLYMTSAPNFGMEAEISFPRREKILRERPLLAYRRRRGSLLTGAVLELDILSYLPKRSQRTKRKTVSSFSALASSEMKKERTRVFDEIRDLFALSVMCYASSASVQRGGAITMDDSRDHRTKVIILSQIYQIGMCCCSRFGPIVTRG